jgi:DNA-binding response OmpR family regulator
MEKTGGNRLLIVENDLASLFTLRTMFARAGWDVTTSRTLAGALASLLPAPAWIILDLGLSDGDGEEVLRRVRECGIGARIAVLSGVLDSERIARLSQWSPELMLSKPMAFEDLLEAVERFVPTVPSD